MGKKNSNRIKGPIGFRAGGISSGVKSSGVLDLGMIACDEPAVTAAVTTTNRFAAAPVRLCRERLTYAKTFRGVIVNSGNANAVTGTRGLKDAERMTRAAEKACGCPPESFLAASTGIIGRTLPMAKITKAIPRLAKSLSTEGWSDFADAILTLDTRPRISSRTISLLHGGSATVLGIAKGAGMIHPNMATMLAFIVTDYPLSSRRAGTLLRSAVEESFHCLTVDGQTSTNDTAMLLSSGRAGGSRLIARQSANEFREALTDVCQDLAKQMAADGEGATKLATIEVRGTSSRTKAKRLAMEVAQSNLVKTALFGELPNWGRIVQAMGQSAVMFEPEDVTIDLQGVTIFRRGTPVEFDWAKLRRAMKHKEISIEIVMGDGPGRARVWTCDLGHGYIKINAAYN